MKTLIAITFALCAFSTSAFAQECDEGQTWDEETQTCIDAGE